MNTPFSLTIDWLSFTIPSGTVKETMAMLGGEWIKDKGGFRGYLRSWMTVASDRGVGKLGTGAERAPLEVHVDLSAGIVSAWPPSKVQAVLQWVRKREGHLTRLDCALDDRASIVPLSTIKQAIEGGQRVTRVDRLQVIASSSIHTGTPQGETLYIGSPHSQTLLRIYDKRAELQSKGREEWESYGIRGNCNSSKTGRKSAARCSRVSKSPTAGIHHQRAAELCGLPGCEPLGTG